MPIDDEWGALYPDDWDAISASVREEAGQCCEWCGAPNRTTITRKDGTRWWTIVDTDHFGEATWRNGDETATSDELLVMAMHLIDEEDWNIHSVDVVLTVAHLNHDPRDCRRENLRALCQSCHITYDKQPEQRRRREMLRAELCHGQLNLLGGEA